MVKSLRSLCLLKVSSGKQNYEDLPPSLKKDLNIMKVFNGNFSSESENKFGSDVHQTTLTILYDGVSWTFSSRSQSFHIFCCFNCDTIQPDLQQLTVKEGEQVPLNSPFSHLRHWLAWVAGSDKTQQEQLDMKMTVDHVDQEGYFGDLAFRGCGGSVLFSSLMQVDFTREGTRVLSHRGDVYSRLGTRNFFNNLYESTVSAEDAYQEISDRRCEFDGFDWDYVPVDTEETLESESCLTDFWEMIENEYDESKM
eukprot:GFUD01010859.1.p1 GENE.GFUD01010859.1~~GFUD01010859.1.p1  ORF type:complete len:253 (+),score=82.41 GFUD01010859.1:55-813(+)